MIEVKGLSKNFGGAPVLDNISFSVAKGEHIALIGPSGVGKSVLLRCLNGLVKPDAGEITVGGLSLTGGGEVAHRAALMTGMVFQQFNLFSHLRAVDNVALAPARVLGLSAREAVEKAEALLKLVGLADKRNAYPSELSGGQQQRVGIARALAMEPKVLLFDEPTSALDPSIAAEVLDLILRVASGDKTVLVVTHELQFVRSIANRVFFIAEGTIYEQGSPADVLDRPKLQKTREFVGRTGETG